MPLMDEGPDRSAARTPRHRSPLALGPAPRGQHKNLALDFGMPVALLTAIPSAAIADRSGLRFWSMFGAMVVLASIILWRRITKISVQVADGKIRIVNVLWSWTLAPSQVSSVVTRRAWFGGIYADCFGLRLKGPWAVRSIPAHALSGSDEQTAELAALLGVPVDTSAP